MTVPGTDTTGNSNDKDTVLVKIPSRPSVRSASSSSSTASTELSAPSNLAIGPADQLILRHGRPEDSALMAEMQVSNYLRYYQDILPRVYFDNLDYDQMTAGHAKNLT
ncbi:hypothetical protein BGX28_003577, partial [Mortierella sp. GBA30]